MSFELVPQPSEQVPAVQQANRIPQRQLRGMEMFRALLGVVTRTRLGRLLSFSGKRDYEEIFGWDKLITIDRMLMMYNRGGIAKRVVDAYPDATWARPPRLWVQGDDAWTNNWTQMTFQWNLWEALHRLDKLAHLGQFAILVVGTDSGRLDTPLTKASKITYLQPYGEQNARVSAYVTDQNDARFGLPAMYQVYPEVTSQILGSDSRVLAPTGTPNTAMTRISFTVHASRVIHVARGVLEDEVFGQPVMAPIWDYLTDLRKVLGSSSESYWIMANRGLQADVDKEMSLNADDQAALQTELDEYFHGFRRFIRSKGVNLKELSSNVADPLHPFNVIITAISGTTGIPQRVLIGAEAGHLASTQDKGNWAERIEESRALHVEPRILKPFLAFCLRTGIIAPPEGGQIEITWPEAYRMNPLERSQLGAQTARVLANVTKMLESTSKRAQGLMSDEEIRALIGIGTDNRILSDNPDP